MNCFILEDESHRYPRNQILQVLAGHNITLATNSYQGRDLYKAGMYDLLLLDHDMHGFYEEPEAEDTGTQFVKWLVNTELGIVRPKPKVLLHSQNDEGRRAMHSILALHNFSVVECRFGSVYIQFLKDNFTHPSQTGYVR